jgi:hypothetical protein
MSTPWQVADEIHAANVQMRERAARTEQAEAERDAAIKRAEAAEAELAELNLIIDLIDEKAGPADGSYDKPGMKLSQIARRRLVRLGKLAPEHSRA